MPELSLHHIEQISRDIRRQEITFSHLLEDLIDHVCCDVENEMQTGLNFGEAYKKVKQKMGSRRLKEIQEETLYAVDTKYRYMKNTMKISGCCRHTPVWLCNIVQNSALALCRNTDVSWSFDPGICFSAFSP